MIIIFSCKKENELPEEKSKFHYGSCVAKKNGIKWVAWPSAAYDTLRWKKDAISIGVNYFEDKIWKETIYFARVPLKKGIYKLEDVAGWDKNQLNVGTEHYIEVENGHVAGHIFLLDTLAKSNRFEVTDYNVNSGEIRVKFTATYFIKDRSKAHIIDTVKFTNGEILAKAYN